MHTFCTTIFSLLTLHTPVVHYLCTTQGIARNHPGPPNENKPNRREKQPMIVEPEYPIQTLSGKDSALPERVYLVRQGKQISRIFTPPVLPPSPERNYVLSLTQLLRSTWWSMPDKELWNEAACRVSNLWTDNVNYPLGMNLFLSLNFYRYLYNQTINLTPPDDTTVPNVQLTQIEVFRDPLTGKIRVTLRINHEFAGGIFLYPRLSPSSSLPDKKWRLWEYKSLQRLGTGPATFGPFTPSIYSMDGTPPGQEISISQWCRVQIRPLSPSFVSGSPLTFGPIGIQSL